MGVGLAKDGMTKVRVSLKVLGLRKRCAISI